MHNKITTKKNSGTLIEGKGLVKVRSV